MSEPTRPVLRYHGGKWILAPWIISHFPAHRVYTEAFGGAGSVLLRKKPALIEVYNDLNGDLVNLFRVLRDTEQASELVRLLSLTPWAYDEWQASYTRGADSVEDARRLVVCSQMSVGTDAVCRNGLAGFRNYSRTDKIGSCPVQHWARFPEAVRQIVARIQGRVVVENRPAEHVIAQHDSPDTLHYVDPPYPKASRGDQGDDYSHEMTDEDHKALAATLHSLEGMVVISGYACALYDNDLYHDWNRIERASHADGARKRIEVLWLNPKCADALGGQQSLIGIPA